MSGKGIVLINNETENKQQIKRSQTKKAENSHCPKTVYLSISFLACLYKT